MKDQNTRKLLINHYQAYPKLQISDIFKFLFQSSFGCEHLVSSEQAALNYIKAELDSMNDSLSTVKIDRLDGNYSRVHLSCLRDEVSPEALARLFFLSAKVDPDGRAELTRMLGVARDLIKEGVLPFSLCDFDEQHAKWKEAGYPAIHHSEAFRKAYSPHYRVIANEYINDIYRFSNTEDRA